MAKIKEKEREGISLKKLNYVISAITVIVSVLMLVSLYMTARGYRDVRQNTDNFILCEKSANDLKAGSDYLTEQVRAFTVTGQTEYMDNYFNNEKGIQRRDNALESVKDIISGTKAYGHLEDATKESIALMEREYCAMKLAVTAYGIDIDTCPDEVKNAVISDEYAAMSKQETAEAARSMVFDDIYKEYKNKIEQNIHDSVEELTSSTEKLMRESLYRLNVLLVVQRIMVVVLVIVIAGVIAVTMVQVITPLLRAIPRIKDEKPLSLRGAYEYRFLAKTYNKMYEINRAQKRKLKYDATHDVLTGTFNRAGYENICESGELTDYAVLMIDLDNFKHINDTGGHGAGDRILVKAATEFKKAFRVSDFICRIGGDEFAVIMNGIAAEENRETIIREKLRRINENLAASKDDLPVISVSAGVAFGDVDSDINEVVKAADDALYEVKNHGKHDIRFHEDKI